MARAQQNQNPTPERINPAAEPASTLGGPPPPIQGSVRLPGTQEVPGAKTRTFVETIDPTPPEEGATAFHPEDLARKDGVRLPPTAPRETFSRGLGPDDKLPEIKRYLVMQDSPNTNPRLVRGKVLDELNYDVRHLARVGIRLKELAPDEDPVQVLLNN